MELDPATNARHALPAGPLIGGTVLPTPMPGTALPGGGAGTAGCATVYTQRPRGRTKATQGKTILVTTEGADAGSAPFPRLCAAATLSPSTF